MTAPLSPSRRTVRIACAAAFALSVFYALSISGAAGEAFSLRYLAQSLWDDHRLSVNEFAAKGWLDDHSRNRDDVFVHWPPGPAIVGLPFYVVGRYADGAPASDLPTLIGGEASRTMALFFSVCAGGCVVLLFFVMGRFCASPWIRLVLCANFALAFSTWPLASIYSRHVPTALLVLIGCWGALRVRENARDGSALALCALASGLLPLFDYSAAIIAPFPLVLAWPGWRAARANRALAWPLALLVVGPMLLGAYNTACFGAPWVTSYARSVQHEWARTFAGTFSGSVVEGLRFLLFNHGPIPDGIAARTGFPPAFLAHYRAAEFTGLLFVAPILLLSIPGLAFGVKERRTRAVFATLTAVVVPTLLLMSTHRTLFGGESFTPRYIYHVTPILFAASAYALGRIEASPRVRPIVFRFALVAVVGIGGIDDIRLGATAIAKTAARTARIAGGDATSPASLVAANAGHMAIALVLLAVTWACVYAVAIRMFGPANPASDSNATRA
ncbi:MAG: hypothetical protein IT350_16785 [Deltaproteobacteria bacterium]|nr:hypothetical protein [Deltaproteobacteria bacterium]